MKLSFLLTRKEKILRNCILIQKKITYLEKKVKGQIHLANMQTNSVNKKLKTKRAYIYLLGSCRRCYIV